MADKPNPADFSVNDRPREYDVRIRVEGEIIMTIKADSQEEAKAQAEKLADDILEGRDFADLDDIEETKVESCWRKSPMYRVMRDGKPMQVSHLEAGDLPREPDERGF